MKIIFNSSLPRSGSTLIQNILAQNPSFYCSPTSGVLELLYAARQNFTNLDEFKLQEPILMKNSWLGFCKGALEGFYLNIKDKKVIIDKSRGWMYYYEWLNSFYSNSKIICCIRDIRALISSMEKLHRKNMYLHDPADLPVQMQFVNIENRVTHWLSSPPVGLGIERLKDSILKKNDSKFFFIIYEKFINSPFDILKRLYDYIEEPYFEHNLENIEQKVSENDNIHGVYGDHKIKNKLTKIKEDWNEILGAEISQRIYFQNQWFYKRFYYS